MKKAVGVVLPFLITHLICCGSLLFFLVGSGYLFKLYNESQNRLLLIPSLAVLAITWWILRKKNNECHSTQKKGYLVWKIFLSLLVYLLTSYIFIVYLFIPWWIPGYTGGGLLP